MPFGLSRHPGTLICHFVHLKPSNILNMTFTGTFHLCPCIPDVTHEYPLKYMSTNQFSMNACHGPCSFYCLSNRWVCRKDFRVAPHSSVNRVSDRRATMQTVTREWRECMESCLCNRADVARVMSSRSAAHHLPLHRVAKHEAGAGVRIGQSLKFTRERGENLMHS